MLNAKKLSNLIMHFLKSFTHIAFLNFLSGLFLNCGISMSVLSESRIDVRAIICPSILYLTKIRSPSELNPIDKKGNTPLHIAAEKDQGNAVTYLLQHGAASDVINGVNMAPIHVAADAGNCKALKVSVP